MHSRPYPSRRLSIGMPIYNGQAYMREAIDSLLAQKAFDFELIISDNASTDGTQAICEAYAAADPRVRYIRQPTNLGASGNLKFVLRAARFEYFMWAACDDSWSAQWVETLLAAIEPGDVGVFSGYREGDGIVIHPPTYRRGDHARFFLDSDVTGKCMYAYAVFRSEVILKSDLSYLDCPVGCDQVFLLHLLQWGALRCVPGGVLHYRVHEASVSTQQRSARGRLANLISRYPFAYYRLAFKAVPPRLKTIMWALIPFKFAKEQRPMLSAAFSSVIRRVTASLRA